MDALDGSQGGWGSGGQPRRIVRRRRGGAQPNNTKAELAGGGSDGDVGRGSEVQTHGRVQATNGERGRGVDALNEAAKVLNLGDWKGPPVLRAFQGANTEEGRGWGLKGWGCSGTRQEASVKKDRQNEGLGTSGKKGT